MKFRTIVSIFTLLIFVAACGGGGDNPPANPPADPPVACTIEVSNSQPGLFADGRIRSHNQCSTYQIIPAVRMTPTENLASIDYMVHSVSDSPKALLVLIAGGNGDAKIEGDNGAGQPATRASGNFLVRSAHLFANKGYKVVTIDRPSDHAASNSGLYDLYRQSVDHAVDLSSIINAENTGNLPVVIAGTSRGAISAIPQHKLADAISVSSPVTTGVDGHAVNELSTDAWLRPSSVTVPAHVIWHTGDACDVSTPAGSQTLADNFFPSSAAITETFGGFNADDFGVCGGSSYHGFYGMETIAVNATSTWIDSRAFPASKPTVNSAELNYNDITTTGVDISVHATASNGGALTFSVPYVTTVQGGTVTLTGNTITYVDPGLNSGMVDKFIYIVEETGGGTSHNVLTITIP